MPRKAHVEASYVSASVGRCSYCVRCPVAPATSPVSWPQHCQLMGLRVGLRPVPHGVLAGPLGPLVLRSYAGSVRGLLLLSNN